MSAVHLVVKLLKKIIKEMPGSVASGTQCTYIHTLIFWKLDNDCSFLILNSFLVQPHCIYRAVFSVFVLHNIKFQIVCSSLHIKAYGLPLCFCATVIIVTVMSGITRRQQ